MENQQIAMKQVEDRDSTEKYCTGRSGFRKDANTKHKWIFELGNTGKLTRTTVVVGFQARHEIDSQTHNIAKFDRLPTSNMVCNIGSKKYPVDGMVCIYDFPKFTMKLTYSNPFFISRK